ncbi:MAG: GNAT family N-acetyltransferase [Pyrinomonadaceae bacterium]|nr:GNAT family N-acetyltransferase [Pyrinomonadaceae bacterium]
MVLDNDNLILSAESPHNNKECLDLLAQLLTELSEKYPDELRGTPLIPEELAAAGAAFLVARRDGRPVGCGAIRQLNLGVAEVKRMFVVQEERRSGSRTSDTRESRNLRKEFWLPISPTRNRPQTARGDQPLRICWLSSRALLRPVPRESHECLF